MQLADLLGGTERAVVHGDASVTVSRIDYDSRRVEGGSLFVCLPGLRADGHDFAGEAVAGGAASVLCERRLDLPVAQVVVPDARAAMGPMSAVLHGEPSRRLDVVGVTGTNGKTTTTHLLQHVLEHAGRRCGLIGTLTGERTTPEAPDLQEQLADMARDGHDAVTMEVSSHALDLHRVDGTHFRSVVFTNLSQDHLDYHRSMERYYEAKARLFTSEFTESAVISADDPHGRRLLDDVEVPTVAYHVSDAQDLVSEMSSSSFTWRGLPVRLPLGGRFNVANALAAAETARVLGVDDPVVAAGLSTAPSIAGRYEVVDTTGPFTVLVDYAHTPEGLEQVLSSARREAAGRVILVFGCGGERDRAKRPRMGAVAARLADRVIVTSDNPRSEDPAAIIDDVLQGVEDGAHVRAIPDRRAAIGTAVGEAGDADVVVIAGKGHEATQVVGSEEHPFDDRHVAYEETARMTEARR